MKTFLCIFTFFIGSIYGFDSLVPEDGIYGESNTYDTKVRAYFDNAYSKGVILRAVILPSFQSEIAIGIEKKEKTYDVFSTVPKTSIWNTELIVDYESGRITSYKNGKVIPREKDDSYLGLKKTTPANFKDIPSETNKREIDEDTAKRVLSIWQTMLIQAKHPEQPNAGRDGVSYHFSAWILGRGTLTAQTWSPDQNTRCDLLTSLAETLGAYSANRCSKSDLIKHLEKAESKIQPQQDAAANP